MLELDYDNIIDYQPSDDELFMTMCQEVIPWTEAVDMEYVETEGVEEDAI